MLAYQNETGSAIPESQMQARLNSITELQQQIIAKNSEISALLTYARQDNPRVRAARSQLATLTAELSRLEDEQKTSTPQLSVEYQRYAMNLHLATTAYEVVLKQYENAKIDEAQGFFPLQVVDYATPPDYKFKPSRLRIMLVGAFLGTLLGCMIVVFREFRRNMSAKMREYVQENSHDKEDEDEEEVLQLKPKSKRKNSILVFGLIILVIAAIFFLTFQSEPDTLQISDKIRHILMGFYGANVPLWVKNMHIIRAFGHIPLYFFLAVVSFISCSLYGLDIRKSALTALLISVFIGLSDEMIKIFIPSREFDIIDWVLDIAGSLAGVITAMFTSLIFRRKEHEETHERN